MILKLSGVEDLSSLEFMKTSKKLVFVHYGFYVFSYGQWEGTYVLQPSRTARVQVRLTSAYAA